MKSTVINLNLPTKVKKYINLIIKNSVKKIGVYPISIILFGSLVNQRFKTTSDVDLIIVFPNEVSDSDLKLFKQFIYSLEEFLFKKRTAGRFIDKFLKAVSDSTGMFKSFFITREKDIQLLNFNKIFNVNRWLASIIAPKKIVFKSITSGYRVVFGVDCLKNLKSYNVNTIEILKSLVMCLILGVSSIFFLPFSSKARLYLYEALKWSILNIYLYHHNHKADFSTMFNYLGDITGSKTVIEKIKYFRNKGVFDNRNLLKTLAFILKAHILGLKRFKKMIKTSI
ncbi:MAG: nucleotidyltransferase domain-containing protein [Candidatus Odinarchaeia archaeon]